MIGDLIITVLRLARESGMNWLVVLGLLLIFAVAIVVGHRLGMVKWPGFQPRPDVDEGGPVQQGTVVNSDPKPPPDHGG